MRLLAVCALAALAANPTFCDAASRICDPFVCPLAKCAERNATMALHGRAYAEVTWLDRNSIDSRWMSTAKYIHNFIHGHCAVVVTLVLAHQVLTAAVPAPKTGSRMQRHIWLGTAFAVSVLPIQVMFSSFTLVASQLQEEDPCVIHPVPKMYYMSFFAFGLCHHLMWVEAVIGSTVLLATEARRRALIVLHALSIMIATAALHGCAVGISSVPYESYLWESGLTIGLFNIIFWVIDAANIYRLFTIGLLNKSDENQVWNEHHSMNAIFLLVLHIGTWKFVLTCNEYYFNRLLPGDVNKWVRFAAWIVPVLAALVWKLPKLAQTLFWPAMPSKSKKETSMVLQAKFD